MGNEENAREEGKAKSNITVSQVLSLESFEQDT